MRACGDYDRGSIPLEGTKNINKKEIKINTIRIKIFETNLLNINIKIPIKNPAVIGLRNNSFIDGSLQNIFRKKLDARIIVESDKGHFRDEDGVKELPSVLDSLLKMTAKRSI